MFTREIIFNTLSLFLHVIAFYCCNTEQFVLPADAFRFRPRPAKSVGVVGSYSFPATRQVKCLMNPSKLEGYIARAKEIAPQLTNDTDVIRLAYALTEMDTDHEKDMALRLQSKDHEKDLQSKDHEKDAMKHAYEFKESCLKSYYLNRISRFTQRSLPAASFSTLYGHRMHH